MAFSSLFLLRIPAESGNVLGFCRNLATLSSSVPVETGLTVRKTVGGTLGRPGVVRGHEDARLTSREAGSSWPIGLSVP